MKYTYDMHIHSALSPCAEEEMTPNNIVNMAVLNGLDIIAVTDHNSAGNLQAFKECSDRKGIVFVPGIEVESAEEVHIVCLFADVESACMMGDEVRKNLLPAENKPDIFGTQLFLTVTTMLQVRRIRCCCSLQDYDYRIAIPSSAFYGQFKDVKSRNHLLTALKRIGFDDVYEEAIGAEIVSYATAKLMKSDKVRYPVISSGCPAILKLIQIRFPNLLKYVVDYRPPV